MIQTKYEEIIIIGSWYVAEGVLRTVVEKAGLYGYSVLYLDNGSVLYNSAGIYADEIGIKHIVEKDKNKIADILSRITLKTLVISAGNFYIFPASIVNKTNLTIINFHNSLLPKYPGMNAPTWAIYCGEAVTGITWHLVSKGIDDGAILYQVSYEISKDEKAYQLVDKLMKMAVEVFQIEFDSLITGQYHTKKQELPENRKVYCSCEVPQNGQFSIGDKPDDIYRLLRALDYGKSGVMPAASFLKNGARMMVRRYAVSNEPSDRKDVVFLKLSDGRYLIIHYKELKQEFMD